MVISYAITTHNEHKEIEELIGFLLKHKDPEDEIVILDDYSDQRTWRVFDRFIHDKSNNIKLVERALEGNFSNQKNFLNEQCTGDWIVNIDADEIPHKNLISNIKSLISANPDIELYWVPRINTVDGLTEEHINKWKWNINEKGWVNFPDSQQRIYKNCKSITWQKNVHERLVGAKQDSYLPFEEIWCFYHHKKISKQEKQNKLYASL